MFRVKIGLAAAALVLLVNVAIYLAITMPLSERAKNEVKDAVQRASKMVNVVQEQRAYALLDLAETISEQPSFQTWVKIDEEQERRIAVFDAIDQYDKKLKEQNRKAHFFAVLGGDGAIIARDLDPKNMYGEKLAFDSVKSALDGKATVAIWFWKNRMMRSAAAPIWVDGQIEGAVVVAYDITAAEARAERDMFGAHVAYYTGGAIRASSFSMANDDNTEDAMLVDAASGALLKGDKSPGQKALETGRTTEVFEVELAGQTFMGATGPLSAGLSKGKAGYAVMASVTEAMAPVTRIRYLMLLLLVVSELLVLLLLFLSHRHFEKAEDKLELGVSEVINGNLEYSFEAVQEFEGLANAINVMLNRLLGRPEPSEDDLEASEISAMDPGVLFIDEPAEGDTGSEEARELAEEPEDAYYARLTGEYIAARKSLGLPVEGLNLESLTQRLRANAAILVAKYECRLVRFRLDTSGGSVTLVPVRIV